MVTQVGYSVAGRSRGRVTLSAVCTWHVETRSVGFLVEPQNQGRRFVSGLASKPLERFLAVWPQNLLRRFSPVWPQNWWRRFFPVWPQNRWWVSLLSLKTKVGEGFPVWPEDWWRRDDGWCTWHHRGGCVGGKLKLDGSMQRAASDPATLALLFSFY
jgi:hypothetical protein